MYNFPLEYFIIDEELDDRTALPPRANGKKIARVHISEKFIHPTKLDHLTSAPPGPGNLLEASQPCKPHSYLCKIHKFSETVTWLKLYPLILVTLTLSQLDVYIWVCVIVNYLWCGWILYFAFSVGFLTKYLEAVEQMWKYLRVKYERILRISVLI